MKLQYVAWKQPLDIVFVLNWTLLAVGSIGIGLFSASELKNTAYPAEYTPYWNMGIGFAFGFAMLILRTKEACITIAQRLTVFSIVSGYTFGLVFSWNRPLDTFFLFAHSIRIFILPSIMAFVQLGAILFGFLIGLAIAALIQEETSERIW